MTSEGDRPGLTGAGKFHLAMTLRVSFIKIKGFILNLKSSLCSPVVGRTQNLFEPCLQIFYITVFS
jgi:hypothetical protein